MLALPVTATAVTLWTERDPHTMETLIGQAEKWIYPRIGKTKLGEFSATDAEDFFKELAKYLSKRTLMMITSTLRRSIEIVPS